VQEIIDQAFRLYRRYFLTFLAITAVVFVPVNLAVQLLSVALQGNNVALQRSTVPGSSFDTSESLNQSLTLLVVLFLILMGLSVLAVLLQYLSHGALTSAVADSHLDRPVSFGRAYRTMLKHVGPLLGMIGLQVLIGVGLFMPTIVVFVLAITAIAAGGESGIGTGFMFVCFAFILMFVTVILYAYVFVRLSVIIPALMVENLGPVQAVRRSWQLVQGYWWRTFALMLVLGLINAVISLGPAYLVAAVVALFVQSLDPVGLSAVTGVMTVIMEALFIPLSLTCYTLYYFDLRVRKEGFDLETALNQRYANPGSAPGGYYAGPQGQYPPAGGYAPPQLGYGAQSQPQPPPPSQYPAYPQQAYPQGYEYPQQGYTQPQSYSQPEGPNQGVPGVPASPGGSDVTGANSGPMEDPGAETPRTESLGFSTPSITEQAAQTPSMGSEPQVQDFPGADTPAAGKLEPPHRGSDTPAPDER
jgi:membrane-anchored glycerophosphoryl diester phosphodiesterase (GDPDase)